MSAKYGLQQWCSEELIADAGAEAVGRLVVDSYCDRENLTLEGDVDVRVFDVRTDSNFRTPNDHPEGLPLLLVASFRADSRIGDAGAHDATRGGAGQS